MMFLRSEESDIRESHGDFGKQAVSFGGTAFQSSALPLPQAEVDLIILRIRMALEAVRRGRMDRVRVNHLTTVVLITRFLTEAGHGVIDLAVFDAAEIALGDILKAGNGTDIWTISGATIDMLTNIINEHDRQLREARLQAIVDAHRCLDRHLERYGAPSA